MDSLEKPETNENMNIGNIDEIQIASDRHISSNEGLFKNKKIFVEIFNDSNDMSDLLDEILISKGAQVIFN